MKNFLVTGINSGLGKYLYNNLPNPLLIPVIKNLSISDPQKRYNVYLKFLYYLKTIQ